MHVSNKWYRRLMVEVLTLGLFINLVSALVDTYEHPQVNHTIEYSVKSLYCMYLGCIWDSLGQDQVF